jgi:hypothetical protein
MKTTRTLIQACLLFAAMLPAAVNAQFTFTTNSDGSLNVYQYTGSGGAVTIPDTTNGLPITSVGTNAFYDCTSLSSLTTGTNLTSIGDYAFHGCTGLTNVLVGTNVTSIGDFAFQGLRRTAILAASHISGNRLHPGQSHAP